MFIKRKKEFGFSVIELLVVIVIIGILSSVILLYSDPAEKRRTARDNKRLSDISLIDSAVNEYLLDNGAYPDDANTLRSSDVLPGESISLDNSTSGWIKANLSTYTSHLPVDPLNEDVYIYRYFHDVTGYELNAVMESLIEHAENDGGNDPAMYETGNNLLLISP